MKPEGDPTTECVYPNSYKAREVPTGPWKLVAGRGTLGDLNWGPSEKDSPREKLQEQLVEMAMHVTETVLLSGGGGPGSSTAILLGAEITEESYGLRLQVHLRDIQGAVNMETFDPFIDSWQISVKEAAHAS
jgi:hypothetical protein